MLTTALFPFYAAAADIPQARELYQHTDYAAALKILQTNRTPTAEVWALTGKTRFMMGDTKDAIDNLQKAVQLEPGNADYVLWLARAWGRKAERSNPFTAMSAASRAHEYFEKAVALDPHSQEATGDLFDYYLEIPVSRAAVWIRPRLSPIALKASIHPRAASISPASQRSVKTSPRPNRIFVPRSAWTQKPPDTPSDSPAFSPSRGA